MKVDNPRFGSKVHGGFVWCEDCPFEDIYLCVGEPCPTAETYAEACEVAAKEAQ